MEEWNLWLELLSPSLPIAAAFVFFSLSVWDKYGWCVVAPLLLLTQRISFIYCRDYIAICCVFTTWLRVVIDMFATWGLDVCKWTFLFHVCVWKSDVSTLIFHHHSRAAALQAQPAWLHRKIQIRPRKYGGRWGLWDLQCPEGIENSLVHVAQSTWSSVHLLVAVSGPVLCMAWTG